MNLISFSYEVNSKYFIHLDESIKRLLGYPTDNKQLEKIKDGLVKNHDFTNEKKKLLKIKINENDDKKVNSEINDDDQLMEEKVTNAFPMDPLIEGKSTVKSKITEMDRKTMEQSIIYDAKTARTKRSNSIDDRVSIEDPLERTKEWVEDHPGPEDKNIHEKSITTSKNYTKTRKNNASTFDSMSKIFESIKNVFTEKPKAKRGRPPKLARKRSFSRSPSGDKSSVNERQKLREQKLRPKRRVDYRKMAGKKDKLNIFPSEY